MELVNLLLPGTNKFASSYYKGINEIEDFFHYQYNDNEAYVKRLEELQSRTFQRIQLAEHISHFMKPFPTSEKVEQSIEKLKKNNSVVVIGGQQAGLLTGPLYSIHKVISIIAFAKQKEKELNIPVVPVFWIAGEDHDFPEINHIYQESAGKMKKWNYPEKAKNPKKMITDYELDKDRCIKWVQDIIEALGETEYSQELLLFLEESIERSHTFVDFFANIIMELFKEDGLLIVDSGNSDFRQLQKDILAEQIQQSKAITEAVINQQKLMQNRGFNLSIEISSQAANLFYYDRLYLERHLLEHSAETNNYVAKDGDIQFSFEQLMEIAAEQPQFLSNNVVTRPITQELLFPTIGFIAGPGEISYWAELKQAFELFSIKMPPIVPRINITFLEREIESDLNDLNLDLQRVLEKGIADERETFIAAIKDKSYAQFFSELRETVDNYYEQLEEKVSADFRGILPIVAKNKRYVDEQFYYMENKIEETLLLQHDVRLKKYDRIECALRPLNGPQERVWNILYFLNRYGLRFLDDINNLPLHFDGKHKVIKI